MIKNIHLSQKSQKNRNRKEFSEFSKGNLLKNLTKLMVKLKAFPVRLEMSKECPLFSIFGEELSY